VGEMENGEFKSILGYIVRSCFKTKEERRKEEGQWKK
jgi:hypothetical protein